MTALAVWFGLILVGWRIDCAAEAIVAAIRGEK
jgi:hypothetical protein